MQALVTLGRDRLVALLAVFVFGVSALPFIGWYKDLENILPRAPDPLSALNTPITLLFQSPGSAGTNAVPSLVWIPLLLAFLIGVVSFASGRLRRIVYIACGLLGIAVLAVLFVQFGRYADAAGESGTFGHVTLGQYVFLGACVISIVAGIIVPRAPRPGRHDSADKTIKTGPETGAHDGLKAPRTPSVPATAAGSPTTGGQIGEFPARGGTFEGFAPPGTPPRPPRQI